MADPDADAGAPFGVVTHTPTDGAGAVVDERSARPPEAPRVCVQYVSDLHLEVTPEKYWERGGVLEMYLRPQPGATVLVLAGDIGCDEGGSLRAVLTHVSQRWPHVVYVMGNHEYYRLRGVVPAPAPRSFEAVEAGVRALVATFPNVHLLCAETPTWELPGSGVVFVGCTLWSDLHGTKAEGAPVMDFREARTTPGQTTALWRHHTRVLARALGEMCQGSDAGGVTDAGMDTELAQARRRVVVVTHHLPSVSLIDPKFRDSPTNAAFASNCEWLMDDVALWIYGHTHIANDMVVNGCRCVVNPVGHPCEVSNFDPAAVVWV